MIMPELLDNNQNYLNAFAGMEPEIDGRALPQMRERRRLARARFSSLGFPTRRNEEWRFTSVSPIVETPFTRATQAESVLTPEQLAAFTFEGFDGHQLVFVNGFYAPELSSVGNLPLGVTVGRLADAPSPLIEPHLARHAAFDAQAFVALNTAALDDGAFVHIPRNIIIDAPIHLLFVSTAAGEPTISHPRTLIIAEENSQATLIESYAGPEGEVYFCNAVTEAVCGENAVIDHYKLQRESRQAFHVATTQLHLARSSNWTSHAITLGGSLARNDVNATLAGEGIECTLNGLYLGSGRQIIDNHTAIDHAMPHCNSHEIYKGILDDHARGVFNGKIFVRQDAQKTDAKQTNQTLLLSNDAQVNTKPQLEIFADDVKCTHGATIGQLSDEALFYLRARGIPQSQARDLLIYAFASDIVSRIQIDPIRAHLDHILLADRALEGLEE